MMTQQNNNAKNMVGWQQDDDGVVILTMDDPAQSANIMNQAYTESMRATVDRLLAERDGKRIRVAGVVTHRQRPATASGVVFFGLEDETGLINVTVTPGLWRRHRTVARTARALVVRGLIRNANGVANLSADLIEALPVGELLSAGSRDFR